MPQPTAQPDAAWWSAFSAALLRWYRKHHRRLPWRATPGKTANPYHVLVSEAMLQQTQVATVIDYFNRFITRWPTLESLAAADEQQVLSLWQGLGYYRRARNLHRAAQRIVADHAGQVPHTLEVLLTLPGVGRYTAGAIASIAHNQPTPILDGNVKRVLTRLFAIDQPLDDRKVVSRLWALAEAAVAESRHPSDFNQAMMELGAMVCTPKSPQCLTCGVRQFCLAAERGVADQLPITGKRAKPVDVTHHVYAIVRRGRYLFEQRGDTGLWSGMWQLTTGEGQPPDTHGLLISPPVEIGCFIHITTHRRICFIVHHATVQSGRLRSRSAQWRALDDISDLPISNAQRKVIALVKAQGTVGPSPRPRRAR